MRKSLLPAIALIAIPATLAAQEIAPPPAAAPAPAAEPGMPDPAAVVLALDSHPSVEAARARTGAAEAEARALARGPHELTFSGSYLRRSVDREGSYNEFDGQLTRALRLPGKARLDREIGRFGIDAATNLTEDTRHQAALLLNEGWWDWLGAAEQARVDRQAVANYTMLLKATKRRVGLRDAAQLDADQAEAQLGTAKLAAQQSAGREAIARARLVAQFPGLPLGDSPPPVPTPRLPEQDITALGALVVERSHEIAAAEARAAQAGAGSARARAERIADPSLGVRMFSERGGAERGVGVLFSMPFGGGYRKAQAEQAEAQASAAQADLTATRFAVDEMAQGDITGVRYALTAWQAAREGLNAQIAALEKLRLGLKAGEIDLADELLGERQVHDAFRAEAQARTEAMRALTKLRIDSHTIWVTPSDEH